ncbi:MAG: acyl-CoA carboxylase subunit beta [Nitrososphaerota archaeon]|nr:acyl-CoA carboxylase subunit beta [Nitrososphaerales archaeon]MDW8044768.1 acyl-CoA carboxylase subunit beta [Nitrososphaerota archaeon]
MSDSKIEGLKSLRERLKKNIEERANVQHSKGKLSAIERINALLDPGSFLPMLNYVVPYNSTIDLQKLEQLGDGVVAGYGTIDGRGVIVFAEDFTFMGGSMGVTHLNKISRMIELAVKMGLPIIGLYDSGGARIQEGVHSLTALGGVFYNNVMASGYIPQIAVIMGPCAGGACYSPALMDFIIMVEKVSYMFITGPRVVKSVTGEDKTPEELGGPAIHATRSGVATHVAKNDLEAMQLVRRLVSYLPNNALSDPPFIQTDDPVDRIDPEVNRLVPEDQRKPYDVKALINRVFDRDTFLEVHKDFAPNAVVGFARLGGHSVGVVANQPKFLGGVLDIDSSDKISRFIRFCNTFNIPLFTFVDTPGYMPGTKQEHGGIIRHGAKVIYAYSEATVPKVTVIVRKAYGGAYIAMCSRLLGADVVYAYPTAEIAVMGPEGAIEIIYRKEIEATPPEEREAFIRRLVEEYRERWANPYEAASRGHIDDVILPEETRSILYRTLLRLLKKKYEIHLRKKHGIIPA